MGKVRINDLPVEERLFFLKRFKTKYFEENFDELYEHLEEQCKKRGYKNKNIKFITEGKYVNAYVLIEMIS